MATVEPHTLSSLPPEIRLHIYPYLLSTRLCRLQVPEFPDPIAPSADEHVPRVFSFHPAILRTCRLIYEEASSYIRTANTFIRISTPWAQSASRIAGHGRVPLAAVGHVAQDYHDAALEVTVTMPGEGAWEANCCMLLALEDLETFTQFWYFSSLSFHMLNPQLGLKLEVREITRTKLRLQERLLMPFTAVKNLAEFKVDGPADESIVARLKKGIGEPFPTPENCLERCTSLKDEGNALLKNGRFRDALQKYNDAHAAIFVIVDEKRRDIWGEEYFQQRLSGGLYDGQVGIMVAMTLRVKLVANTMLALLKLEDWAMARYWGERSIRLVQSYMESSLDEAQPDIPGGTEIGKILYRTAFACKNLDDADSARENFRIAERWLPNSEAVRIAASEGRLRLG